MPVEKAKFAEIINIETPKRFLLDGFWFGPAKAKQAFVFIHGLGSTGFGHHSFLLPFVDRNSSVLFFSNRGHANIVGIRKKTNSKKGYKRVPGGMALERFSDCIDDIEGAVRFAERRGARKIYLVGHSTGSQKVAYYLAKKKNRKNVAGGILMAPISDYAGIKITVPAKVIERAGLEAKKLMKARRPLALLPQDMWEAPISAQRFMSLYQGSGAEEVFPYWTKRRPSTLLSVKKPLLIVLAEQDQHADRRAEEMEKWFVSYLKSGDAVSVIKRADHGFRKREDAVVREIKTWINSSR